jgi:hypothetical protein
MSPESHEYNPEDYFKPGVEDAPILPKIRIGLDSKETIFGELLEDNAYAQWAFEEGYLDEDGKLTSKGVSYLQAYENNARATGMRRAAQKNVWYLGKPEAQKLSPEIKDARTKFLAFLEKSLELKKAGAKYTETQEGKKIIVTITFTDGTEIVVRGKHSDTVYSRANRALRRFILDVVKNGNKEE